MASPAVELDEVLKKRSPCLPTPWTELSCNTWVGRPFPKAGEGIFSGSALDSRDKPGSRVLPAVDTASTFESP